MEKLHSAVILAADNPAIMSRLETSGNTATRKAAEHMALIRGMHGRNNYQYGEEMQHANDALFYLPMDEVQKLCAAYESR